MMRWGAWAVMVATTVGCQGMERSSLQTGVANRSERPTAETRVEQQSGGDALNVSPSVAVTGSGWLALVALAVLVLLWREFRRSRRALRTLVSAIEAMDETAGALVKREVSGQALRAGMADYVHRVVKSATS